VKYDFESIASHATAIGYLSYKIRMIWWRAVGCHIRNWKTRNERHKLGS
jgi:hypothetical protein